MLRDHEMAKLKDTDGRDVYTTSGLPVSRGWIQTYYPPIVWHEGRLFYDTKMKDRGFRIYALLPTLRSMGE